MPMIDITVSCLILAGYVALNLNDMLHVAQCIFMAPFMVGYTINYGSGLVLSSQHLILLIAGSYLVTFPPYLVAEWLSNRRSITHCLGSPESSHDVDT